MDNSIKIVFNYSSRVNKIIITFYQGSEIYVYFIRIYFQEKLQNDIRCVNNTLKIIKQAMKNNNLKILKIQK